MFYGSKVVSSIVAPSPRHLYLSVRYLANMSSFHLTGGCTCGGLQYKVELDSADYARTSLCHCSSCKKAFGTNYGLTSKVSTPTTKSISVSELTQVPDPDRELQIHKG